MKQDDFHNSLNYAIEGIINTLLTQRNMKIHFLAAFLILLAGFFLGVSRLELIILFLVICLIIVLELLNTAIEIIVDMISKEYSYKAKIVKNTAAGAVLIGAIAAVFTGYMIFVDKIDGLTLDILSAVRRQPLHIIFINLGLLFLLIIALKTWYKRGTPLEGGMPSGHSAIAFSMATMIFFLNNSILIISLSFCMALLVAHSRVNAEVHSFYEVLAGALLGIGLTVLLFLFL